MAAKLSSKSAASAPAPAAPPAARELPADHPFRAIEQRLTDKLQTLAGLDERQQHRGGGDLRAARKRTENQLDEIRAAIARELQKEPPADPAPPAAA